MSRKRGYGKRSALLVGLSILAILGVAFFYRERLWAGYLERQWKRIAVIVLDNCDPKFEGPEPRGDGITFLDERGERIRVLGGLNNAEGIGANHGIALDPERFRVYFREDADRRITALDSTGNILFRLEGLEAQAVAVDLTTGNVWCAAGSSLLQGELKVFDTEGSPVATHPICGFDLAYSPHDQAFWVAGYEVTKCDREGKVMALVPRAGWAKVSIAPDPRDGGAWAVERSHPDVRNSRNALLRLDARGNVVREVELGAQHPFCVACDPETGTAWMVEHNRSIVRFPVVGPPLEPIHIPGALAISIGLRARSIWVSTKEAVLELDHHGSPLLSTPLRAPSSQSWLAAP